MKRIVWLIILICIALTACAQAPAALTELTTPSETQPTTHAVFTTTLPSTEPPAAASAESPPQTQAEIEAMFRTRFAADGGTLVLTAAQQINDYVYLFSDDTENEWQGKQLHRYIISTGEIQELGWFPILHAAVPSADSIVALGGIALVGDECFPRQYVLDIAADGTVSQTVSSYYAPIFEEACRAEDPLVGASIPMIFSDRWISFDSVSFRADIYAGIQPAGGIPIAPCRVSFDETTRVLTLHFPTTRLGKLTDSTDGNLYVEVMRVESAEESTTVYLHLTEYARFYTLETARQLTPELFDRQISCDIFTIRFATGSHVYENFHGTITDPAAWGFPTGDIWNSVLSNGAIPLF